MAVTARVVALCSVLVLAGCGNYSAGGTVGLLLIPVPVKVAACVLGKCWRGAGDAADASAPAGGGAGPAVAAPVAAAGSRPAGANPAAIAGQMDAMLAAAGPLF